MVAPLWFNSGVGTGTGTGAGAGGGVVVAELGSELHGLRDASSHPVSVAFARACH